MKQGGHMCVFKTLIRQICWKLLTWYKEFAELKIEKWAILKKNAKFGGF